MNALRPRNFPYILCRTVLRKSRSRGSSLSKSSRSWRTNFWSITFLPILGWKSGDSRKRKKNSYTSWNKSNQKFKFNQWFQSRLSNKYFIKLRHCAKLNLTKKPKVNMHQRKMALFFFCFIFKMSNWKIAHSAEWNLEDTVFWFYYVFKIWKALI